MRVTESASMGRNRNIIAMQAHVTELSASLGSMAVKLSAEIQRREAAEAVVDLLRKDDEPLYDAIDAAEDYRAKYPKEPV